MGYIQDDVVMITILLLERTGLKISTQVWTIENILLYFRERDWSKLCTCKNNENVKDGEITAKCCI